MGLAFDGQLALTVGAFAPHGSLRVHSAFDMDAFEQHAGGFVVRILWHELAGEGLREDRLAQAAARRASKSAAPRVAIRMESIPAKSCIFSVWTSKGGIGIIVFFTSLWFMLA